MDKDKIIVSVVIDKQALIDKAFGISNTPSEFNELKKVIEGKKQFTRDVDEFDDEGKKENNTNLFANIALDIILSDCPELAITKRLKSFEDKKNIICHAPVTSSHFGRLLKKDNVLPVMNGVTTPKLFGIHADKKFKRGRWRRVLTH